MNEQLEQKSSFVRRRVTDWAEHWALVIPLFFLSAIVANIPLNLFQILFCSEDLNAYYRWTDAFTAAVLEGHWRPRWDASGLEGLGSPAFLYVSPAFFYIASIFRALGADVWMSMRMVVFMVSWGLGLLVWFGLKKRIPARWSVLGGLCAQFNPFLFHAISLHNLFPFYAAVVPVTWFFFASISHDDAKINMQVALSLTILVLTHQLVGFMALLTFPFIFLPRLWQFADGAWKQSFSWACSCALGLLLAGYFLYPALTTQQLIQTADWFEPGHIDWRNSFIVPVVTYVMFGMRWGGVQWGLGGVVALSLAVLWGAILKGSPGERHARPMVMGGFCIVLAGFLLASEISFGLWSAIPFLQMIHWPYRFLIILLPISVLALSAVAAMPYRSLVRWSALLVLSLYPALHGVLQVRNISVYERPDFSSLRVQHYLRVSTEGAAWRNYVVSGGLPAECEKLNVSIVEKEPSTHGGRWLFDAGDPVVIRLPLQAFPGWAVDVDGKTVQTGIDSDTGLLTVGLDKGLNEVVVAWTSVRQEQMGLAMSVTAVVIISVLIFMSGRNRIMSGIVVSGST